MTYTKDELIENLVNYMDNHIDWCIEDQRECFNNKVSKNDYIIDTKNWYDYVRDTVNEYAEDREIFTIEDFDYLHDNNINEAFYDYYDTSDNVKHE